MRPIEEISTRFYSIDKISPSSDTIWEELNDCFIKHLTFPHLKTVYIDLQTDTLVWGTPIEVEDTELLEKFYNTLSCIQANPHIFHIRGNSLEFFGRREGEVVRPSIQYL